MNITKEKFLALVEQVLENNTRYESPDYWSTVTCVPEYMYEDVAEDLWNSLASAREYCSRKEGCVCGGDTLGVRRSCFYWEKAQ